MAEEDILRLLGLVLLLALSGFFSGSETALLALDRMRVKYLQQKQHPGAEKLAQLLRRLPVRSIDELYEKVALGHFQCDDIVDQLKEIHRTRVEKREEQEAAAKKPPTGEMEHALIGLAS